MYFLKLSYGSRLFYVNSLYFQELNSNWDLAFLNSSSDSKLGFLNVGLRLYFKLLPNSQKDSKLGFVNVALVELLNFPQFMKKMEY